ncbi:hypothetical protein ES705_38382 [subsurface metagenome]
MFTCLECGKEFASERRVVMHVLAVHPGYLDACLGFDVPVEGAAADTTEDASPGEIDWEARVFVCPGCERRFETERLMVLHVLAVHPGLVGDRFDGLVDGPLEPAVAEPGSEVAVVEPGAASRKPSALQKVLEFWGFRF